MRSTTSGTWIRRRAPQHRQSEPSSGLPPIWSRDICSVTVRAGPRSSLSFLVLHSVGTEMARPTAAEQEVLWVYTAQPDGPVFLRFRESVIWPQVR
jgi:hypothetical protein